MTGNGAAQATAEILTHLVLSLIACHLSRFFRSQARAAQYSACIQAGVLMKSAQAHVGHYRLQTAPPEPRLAMKRQPACAT
jgi:hypothetical protein